jgi:Amidohydrolase
MPRPYYDRFFQLDATEHFANLRKRVSNIPCLVDMDAPEAAVRDLVDVRPGVRPVRVHGEARVLRGARAVPGAEAAHPPRRQHGPAFHILFGSDSPYDPERGPGYMKATIKNLEEIGLSEAEKQAIFSGNIIRLTGLTVKG